MKDRLTLDHRWALGDTVLLTALVRDIHAAYPGRFELSVNTHWTPVWDNNPHVVPQPDRPSQLLKISYAGGIKAGGIGPGGGRVHMLAWYHEDFRRQTGLEVPVTAPRADLHLAAAERAPLVEGRYWVLVAGGKLDLTTKWWGARRYQAVADLLAPWGITFVQVGAAHRGHVHGPLRGVLDWRGRTENVRDLFALIAGADGVLCGVTGAMHLAAAFERPCVVVAGGREEPWWEEYSGNWPGTFGPGAAPVAVPHRFLHTVGMLPCCETKGCWRNRTVPIEAADVGNPDRVRKLCALPVREPGEQPVPRCLEMIRPETVAEAVLSYYADGTLPPFREEPTCPESGSTVSPGAPPTAACCA